jgi:hypothetical protein
MLSFRDQWSSSFKTDNEYGLSYVDFHECVKAASLFLNQIGAFEGESSSSVNEESSEEP